MKLLFGKTIWLLLSLLIVSSLKPPRTIAEMQLGFGTRSGLSLGFFTSNLISLETGLSFRQSRSDDPIDYEFSGPNWTQTSSWSSYWRRTNDYRPHLGLALRTTHTDKIDLRIRINLEANIRARRIRARDPSTKSNQIDFLHTYMQSLGIGIGPELDYHITVLNKSWTLFTTGFITYYRNRQPLYYYRVSDAGVPTRVLLGYRTSGFIGFPIFDIGFRITF